MSGWLSADHRLDVVLDRRDTADAEVLDENLGDIRGEESRQRRSEVDVLDAEVQQGEAKAVVTLDGGNLTVGASANEINGDTTIKGKADIKGETTAPSGNFKALEAGSSFKSPNISDGMAAPAAGSAGKPSAKLQEEEAKKSEGKS